MSFDGPLPFPAPIVSARDLGFNVAGTATTSTLSVKGLNFVTTDMTPSGRLGTAECSTMTWTASTAAFCYATLADPMVVTVGGIAGTMTLSFTYDGVPPCCAKVYLPLSARACGAVFLHETEGVDHSQRPWRVSPTPRTPWPPTAASSP